MNGQGGGALMVSLVIPVKNEAESVVEVLASVAGQTAPPDEVVVVDGGSTDGTPDLTESWARSNPFGARVRVVRTPQASPGRGRNVGIEAARNEWIALTDAGIRLDPDWLRQLTGVAARDPRVDVVYGNFEPVPASFFERCAALTYVPPKQTRGGRMMRGPSVASCLLRRGVWAAVGGFPDLRAAEDLIFMERVQAAGFPVDWAPAATAHWRLQPTLLRTFRKFALYSQHNVWAGRQGHWHYGVARQYLVAASFLALAVFQSRWWLTAVAAAATARVAKSIWLRAEPPRPSALCNPFKFATVGVILLTIDLATFVGWLRALRHSPPSRPSLAERP